MTHEEATQHPHFAGVVFQHYHVSGDERLPNGNPEFAPPNAGQDLLVRLLLRGDGHDPFFGAYAVFNQPPKPLPYVVLWRWQDEPFRAPYACTVEAFDAAGAENTLFGLVESANKGLKLESDVEIVHVHQGRLIHDAYDEYNGRS